MAAPIETLMAAIATGTYFRNSPMPVGRPTPLMICRACPDLVIDSVATLVPALERGDAANAMPSPAYPV
ncbi:MAG TPA: hypothetical protein VHZ32_04210 [Rhizomicrobium sp.]|nr:hypothetical protein [Rhizomicrobium sp.]